MLLWLVRRKGGPARTGSVRLTACVGMRESRLIGSSPLRAVVALRTIHSFFLAVVIDAKSSSKRPVQVQSLVRLPAAASFQRCVAAQAILSTIEIDPGPSSSVFFTDLVLRARYLASPAVKWVVLGHFRTSEGLN